MLKPKRLLLRNLQSLLSGALWDRVHAHVIIPVCHALHVSPVLRGMCGPPGPLGQSLPRFVSMRLAGTQKSIKKRARIPSSTHAFVECIRSPGEGWEQNAFPCMRKCLLRLNTRMPTSDSAIVNGHTACFCVRYRLARMTLRMHASVPHVVSLRLCYLSVAVQCFCAKF